MPVPESVEITNAVMYLVSDEARYVTGNTHVVDGGARLQRSDFGRAER